MTFYHFMSIEYVEQMLGWIEFAAKSADFGSAHGIEDDLHKEVLRAVAAGNPLARELAEAALRSLDIKFERYNA